MRFEWIGTTLVFHAGKGEWYNQPHNKRWDMGEDVAEIPPANWHVELQKTLDTEAQQGRPRFTSVEQGAFPRVGHGLLGMGE